MGPAAITQEDVCKSCSLADTRSGRLPVLWSTRNGSPINTSRCVSGLTTRPLSVQTAITFQAELPRRLVPNPAVRTNRVVLATPPCRFGLRVQGRLEFLSFQELITQAAVERLDEPVLPRMGRGHRDRLRPSLGQPLAQCL